MSSLTYRHENTSLKKMKGVNYKVYEKITDGTDNEKGLSGGVRSGPPPKRGPNPQGIKIVRSKHGNKFLRKTSRGK